MSDSPDDREAEQAFRDAFERHAADAPTTPLDVRRGARRRRWVPYAAAAAVLTVLAGAGIATLGGGADRPDVVADPPPATGGTLGDLPAPQPGHRWVSWRDVAVQVPDSWGYDHEPSSAWCTAPQNDPEPPPPFVDIDPSSRAVSLIYCGSGPQGNDKLFGPAPQRFWQTHVTLEAADGPDRTATTGDWTVATRTLGHVRVRLLTDDPEATEGILDSARTFTTDQNGCDASSPVQAAQPVRPGEAFDVSEVRAVDAISVCQYTRRIPMGEPGLAGSRLVVGADADALLAGLRAAPAGGGPDRPQNCADDMHGDSAIVVRLRTGDDVRDLHAYWDWCTGNGTYDGTTIRALTADTCAPLFGEPVRAVSYQSNLRKECGPFS